MQTWTVLTLLKTSSSGFGILIASEAPDNEDLRHQYESVLVDVERFTPAEHKLVFWRLEGCSNCGSAHLNVIKCVDLAELQLKLSDLTSGIIKWLADQLEVETSTDLVVPAVTDLSLSLPFWPVFVAGQVWTFETPSGRVQVVLERVCADYVQFTNGIPFPYWNNQTKQREWKSTYLVDTFENKPVEQASYFGNSLDALDAMPARLDSGPGAPWCNQLWRERFSKETA